jgi:hypothetical protein
MTSPDRKRTKRVRKRYRTADPSYFDQVTFRKAISQAFQVCNEMHDVSNDWEIKAPSDRKFQEELDHLDVELREISVALLRVRGKLICEETYYA